jgi:hypothetical protein
VSQVQMGGERHAPEPFAWHTGLVLSGADC